MSIVDWAALKTTDFPSRTDERSLAVLPLGATEQHGPHLPLGTDTHILEGILDELRRRQLRGGRALLLPLVPIGLSPEHHAFPGTLTVGAETLLALWCDLVRSAARAGVRRVLLLTSHGGNSALAEVAAFRLRDELGLLTATLTTHRLGAPEGMLSGVEARYGIHGGQAETAMMRVLRPQLVAEAPATFTSRDHELATASIAYTGGPARVAWRAEDLNPAGAIGDAASATAADGRALLDHLVGRIVEAIEDLLAWPLPVEDVSR